MNIFKFQHPSDLISRLFILEYMREIGASTLYSKANKHQRNKFFYKFTSEDTEGTQEIESVDINYEYCLFIATLHELESFLKLFLDEIEQVEASRQKIYKEAKKKLIEERIKAPVDINIMDLAQTEINKNNSNELIL
jgi:hypothetical protein